jgi:hypothetical protein
MVEDGSIAQTTELGKLEGAAIGVWIRQSYDGAL